MELAEPLFFLLTDCATSSYFANSDIYVLASGSRFCVVQKPNVVGVFSDLQQAKAKLNTVIGGSRMICEVKNGVFQPDPHTVG